MSKLNFKRLYKWVKLKHSPVMVIIGLLVIGVSNGQRLINKGRLSKAIILTNSAPVAGVEGLALWLESTYPDSITKDEKNLVSVWHDLSPFGNDVTQTDIAKQPKFVSNALNGVSALKFDGEDDFMKKVVTEYNSPTTVFVVYKSEADQVNSASLFSSSDSVIIPDFVNSFQFNYSSGLISFSFSTSSGTSVSNNTLETSSSTEKSMVCTVMDGSDSVKVYKNGLLKFSDNSTISPKFNTYKIAINRGSGIYFNGYIAEVIVYNKAISDDEREEVESYLAEKYGITLGS